ncbi:MAG: manganese efflux pump MntP family protein [Verrucomicrobia bacterium]|nr:manganese efflux pump MntP family protein [Verrucomicrobiota bacterium]
MGITKIFLVAVAVAMDAFAVSIAAGVSLKTLNPGRRFRLSWHFGLFQALMPLIGWYLGSSVHSLIERFDHWIAFGLLALVGVHMIRDFFSNSAPEEMTKDPTRGLTLLFLSISTSIDALAVGISMSMVGITIFFPVVVIGLVAMFFTLIGLEIGARMSRNSRISPFAQLMGGAILLAIGVSILYEHGVFNGF